MYNFKLKEFQNGTVQLTYYDNPIKTKDDKFDYITEFDEYRDLNRDCDNDYTLNPFVSPAEYYSVTNIIDGAKLGSDVSTLSDEELKAKKEHSLISSLNRSKKMIYDYGRSNTWEWFLTFTFKDSDAFSKSDYDVCKKKMLEFFKNVRKRHSPDIKYLVVPEQHKSGCWHFHALLSDVGNLDFKPAKNNQRFIKDLNGNLKLNKKGEPVPNKYYGLDLRTSYPNGDYIYNLKNYKQGFTTATKIKDTYKSVSYLVKYITKDLCEITLNSRRYFPSNNLQLPTVSSSLLPDKTVLDRLLTKIEYYYNVKLSTDVIKTYKVDVPGYKNTVTVFEFNNTGKEFDQEMIGLFWENYFLEGLSKNEEYLLLPQPD